jgi:hypothetical protein
MDSMLSDKKNEKKFSFYLVVQKFSIHLYSTNKQNQNERLQQLHRQIQQRVQIR